MSDDFFMLLSRRLSGLKPEHYTFYGNYLVGLRLHSDIPTLDSHFYGRFIY